MIFITCYAIDGVEMQERDRVIDFRKIESLETFRKGINETNVHEYQEKQHLLISWVWLL